jgi:acyl carrier protein
MFRQVPPGITGELFLSGASISPGYLNQPEQTADRFLDLELNGVVTHRVYKTGDLVRYLDDGNLQFLGRNDEQIKLRGYRIELGEIESALRKLPTIRQAAIVPKRDLNGSPQKSAPPVSKEQLPITGLVAFITSEQDETLNTAQIKSSLAEFLPEHMIPGDFIVLDSLPLNPNGKVDRARLPDPDSFTDQNRARGIPPETFLQKDIAAIWGDVLGIDNIYISDNFFDLGGHSLMAVKLFARIKSKTGIDLPLATLFGSPTLRDLVTEIELESGTRSHSKKETPPGFEKAISSDNRAAHLKPLAAVNRWDVIVPIRADGSLPPLFLLHAVFGNILNYAAVLPFLDARQPLYAVQAVGLDGLSRPFKDFDKMIDFYTLEVQKIQPKGPYQLAGLSLGGVLALELGHSLQKQGEEIRFLGMFDSLEPPVFSKTLSHAAAGDAQDNSSIPSQHQPHPLKRPKKQRLPHPGILSRLPVELPNTRSASIFSHLANLSVSYIFSLLRRPRPADLREWLILYSHLTALKSFKPKDYDIDITLFRSTTSNLDDRYDYGWGSYTRKSVEVIEVAAGHGNKFLESPDFAQALDNCLRQ